MPAWSSTEIKLLRQTYPTTPTKKVALLLPRHSVVSIRRMAAKLKVRRWHLKRVHENKWLKIARAHKPIFNFR